MELQNHPLAQYSKLPDAWNKEILVVQSTPWITFWHVIYSMSNDYHYGVVLGLLSPFYICVNQESERFGNLSKATQLEKGQSWYSSPRGSGLKAYFLILKRTTPVIHKTQKCNKAKTSPQ